MNEHEVAVEVTKMEGLHISLSVAQVKEVLRCHKDLIRSLSHIKKLRYILKVFF